MRGAQGTKVWEQVGSQEAVLGGGRLREVRLCIS